MPTIKIYNVILKPLKRQNFWTTFTKQLVIKFVINDSELNMNLFYYIYYATSFEIEILTFRKSLGMKASFLSKLIPIAYKFFRINQDKVDDEQIRINKLANISVEKGYVPLKSNIGHHTNNKIGINFRISKDLFLYEYKRTSSRIIIQVYLKPSWIKSTIIYKLISFDNIKEVNTIIMIV